MQNGFLFIIIFIKLFNYISNYKYQTFNDEYTFFNISGNNNFGVYLGNELIFLNFSFNETGGNHIKLENNSINFYYDDKNKSKRFLFNETKVYYQSDKIFLFVDETSENKLNFSEDLCLNDSLKFELIKYDFIQSSAEYIFVEYIFLAYCLLIFGCLISSYGAYHFMLGLIIHIFFLIYFALMDLINYFTDCERYITYIIFGCLLISLTISYILRPKNELNEKKNAQNEENSPEKSEKLEMENKTKKNMKKLLWINGFYGATFFFAIFKTLIYYYIYFEFDCSFISISYKFPIYLVVLIVIIALGVIFNLIDFFKKYRYLPCSAVAGSFYIIKGIEYIIGGYYSSIIFYKYDLKFKNENRFKTALTYFSFQIAIIIYSIIFQINYLKMKENSIPSIGISNRESDANSATRNSDAINNTNENLIAKDEEEALLENKIREENSLNGNEEIDDQED